jgi:hypothetical protein
VPELLGGEPPVPLGPDSAVALGPEPTTPPETDPEVPLGPNAAVALEPGPAVPLGGETPPVDGGGVPPLTDTGAATSGVSFGCVIII